MRFVGSAELRNNGTFREWRVTAEPHVLLRLRRIFPRLTQRAGAAVLRDTDEVCAELLWVCDRWPLRMEPGTWRYLCEQATTHRETVEGFAAVVAGEVPARPIATALPLRSYQAVAVELALRAGGLLVGDELGVGKTAIGIGVLADTSARPGVVVTMTHLVRQWAGELQRFLPGLRVHVAQKGTPYDVLAPPRRRGGVNTGGLFRMPATDEERERWPEVVVLPYSKLAGWADTLSLFSRAVVFDECQELRLTDSNRYASAKVLADACALRVGLTATPVYNYGDEMWSIFNIVRPGELGSREEFLREWCVDEKRVREPQSFGTYLRSAGLYLRRSRADVGRELPPLTIVPVTLDVDEKPLRDAKGVAADLARRILAREEERQGDRWRASGELDWRLRQATGLAKAPAVAAFVQLLVEQGEQVVLAGWHKAVYAVWREAFGKAGITHAMYTGDESPAAKEAGALAFRDGKADVLVLSLRSGAGLDGLQYGKARIVVFGEIDWSPQVHKQLIGRLDRDGQVQSVTAYYLLAETGSDPVMVDVLGVKRQQSLGIEDPMGTELAPVTDSDRTRLLAAAYLASIGESVSEATGAVATAPA